jgi:hypothetical protein
MAKMLWRQLDDVPMDESIRDGGFIAAGSTQSDDLQGYHGTGDVG